MKKLKFLAAAALGISLLLVGCNSNVNDPLEPGNNSENNGGENNNGENGGENNNGEENNDEPSANKKETVQALKFSVGGANALAVVDDESDRSAIRSAARNATTDSMIMKILEDGSMESFITIPEGFYGQLSNVNYIAQSPADDADEIYIVFQSESDFWREKYEERTDEWGNTWTDCVGTEQLHIGQLICVSADGTYDDVLLTEDGTWRWLYGSSKDSIAFDKQGYMYYLVSEYSGNSNTNMIYKYDPKAKESIKLTPAVENTYYQKFQVSDDGKWLFAKANMWSSSMNKEYLRAIPTDNPSTYYNLFYSSGGSWINDWVYDSGTNAVYYTKDGTLYAFPEKDGKFDELNRQEVFTSDNNNSYWFNHNDLFWENSSYDGGNSNYVYSWKGFANAWSPETQSYEYYYFRNPITEEKELQLEEVVKYLFAESYESMIYSGHYDEQGKWIREYGYLKTVLDDEGEPVLDENDEPKTELVKYNANEYEIRFDEFVGLDGYKAFMNELKGEDGKYLSDFALIKTLTEKNLLSKFYTLLESRYKQDDDFQYYDNNFYADVLFRKDDGTKIDERFFRKSVHNEKKYDHRGVYSWDLMKGDWISDSGNGWTYNYTWYDDYCKEEEISVGEGKTETIKVVDSEKVLKKLASHCVTSSIDFKLTAFKDDEVYGALYTDLINEEAIEFINTNEKLRLIAEYCNSHWNNTGAGDFLALTCFKKDSDETAYKGYTNDSSSIYWGNVGNLTLSYGKSLYGICQTWMNNQYIYQLVEILDLNGTKTGRVVDSIKNYNPSTMSSSGDGFCFINKLLNAINEESGYQDICYYDVPTDKVTNLFEKVENNKTSEIISYCMAGDYVYCSLLNGFDISNVKINVETKTATVLSTNQKFSSIISVK